MQGMRKLRVQYLTDQLMGNLRTSRPSPGLEGQVDLVTRDQGTVRTNLLEGRYVRTGTPVEEVVDVRWASPEEPPEDTSSEE